MARTVADAVAIFDVVAGEDPDDPVTAASRGHRQADYRKFVVPGALKGARIGVLRQAYEMAAKQADAAGRKRQADSYREDLKILNRRAKPTAPPAEAGPRPSPSPAPLAGTRPNTQFVVDP
jgi:Asp-tRNA(Asn)/Glu-tRNA(Gln) amidotransferase A subunit family amidase